ncbi:AraC family transcriptional regulator [Phenylobacterium sp.]|uniref:helix-turn-helix domain-containing protein n=1 Tax=Phenylobacterium sp. TaxID=1871053 RepID=UPI00120A19AC|nr:helix-turn-helix domain-containing protein [Phenylobacterium sp.]THD62793.1 MAG: AraC family transcriptional regulator [Phenylobacterium sp.]
MLLIDMFTRGLAVGAILMLGLAIGRSQVSRDARIVGVYAAVTLAAWMTTESEPLWAALGHSPAPMFLALSSGSAFWLLVMVVFEDWPLTWLTATPTILLVVSGLVMWVEAPSGFSATVWVVRNSFSALLSLHAVVVVARGWRGDLMQGRRWARAPLLGFGAVFGVFVSVMSLINRAHPLSGGWMLLEAGEVYGAAIMALLTLALGAVFLQARPSVFGPAGRRAELADARGEAVERAMLQKLDAIMAAEGWRREGLTIGQLAQEMALPEHRLRRLINTRLGHRNFADFLNAHRIEAAKRRLADPAEARTTVAAIAFDLGYGSLGPFNRAFRAVTGVTPTAWRRQALSASPDLQEAV